MHEVLEVFPSGCTVHRYVWAPHVQNDAKYCVASRWFNDKTKAKWRNEEHLNWILKVLFILILILLGLLAKIGHKFYLFLKKNHTHASAMITCCDFKVDRQQWFPGAFFCHRCDMWGQRDISNKSLNWERRVYCCVATHSSYECWRCQDWRQRRVKKKLIQ